MAAACAGAAFAQTAPAGDQTNTVLPQVIVQARRVSENQQKVPVAVTALGAKAMQQDTITQISDLQKNVPSLEIDPGSLGGSGDPRFTVRGLSGSLVSDPSVVTYFDQVPLDPKNFAYQQYDLDSVQVLKGPQGTLFGRNSTGGAVLFEPTRPGPNFGGYVDLRYGNFNDREANGAINLPLGDQVSLRIAADDEQRDGTVTSVTGGFKYDNRDHGSVRAELLYKPNDRYENYLQATYYNVREMNNQPILTGVADPALDPLLGFQQSLGKDKTVNSFPAPFDVDYYGITDIATAHFGGLTVKNIAHGDYAQYHLAYDLTGTGEQILDQDDFQGNHNYSDELQLLGTGFDNRLNWLLGGYYNKYIQNEHEVFDLETQPGNPFSPENISVNQPQQSKALFGQATYDLGQWFKGLSITGGYRYTWDDRAFTQSRTQPGGFLLAGSPPMLVTVPSCAILGFPGTNNATCVEHLSTEFSNYNYNVSLNWQATSNLLVYLASRRGYKAGGFNFAADNPAFIEYQPETVTDVELGLKADWAVADMPVRTNLAVYRARYDDIQAQFVEQGPSGIPEALIVNADPGGGSNKATLTGGEAEVTFVPVRQLRLTGFYGYATGRYDQFVDSSSGMPISLAGQDIDGIAKTTAGLNVDFTPDLPDELGRPEFTANVYGRSKLSSNELNPGEIGGFTNVDLRVDWRGAFHSPVDVAVYGNNVGNDRHVTVDNNLLTVVGVESKQYAEPTTYGIELRYRFGAH